MSRRPISAGDLGLPPLPWWVRNLLAGLLVAYVLELVLERFAGWPLLETLGWMPFGNGFQPWQLLTWPLVQGPQPFNVLLGLLSLFFVLPILDSSLQRKDLVGAAVASVAGTVAVGLVAKVLGDGAPSFGWWSIAASLWAVWGLTAPNATGMFLVIPVPSSFFVWGTGVAGLLFYLAAAQTDLLGGWVGVMAWWYLVGPGGRRRRLISRGKKIERELQRFQVIQGGRDDMWH